MGDLEAVINDMNATTPDVIISVLPSPMQEQFLYEHRDKMNANIWYGIGGVPVHKKKKHGVLARLKSIIHRGKLVNSMNKYDEKRRGIVVEMQKLINKRSIVIDYLMMIVGTGLLAAAIQCLYDPIGLCHRRFLQDLRL